jgi:beta-glucosidase
VSDEVRLPEDWVLGVATSAHQVEGNDDNTDWWDFEQAPGSPRFREASGLAADFWNRFRDDVALMVEHGVQAHRLSVSWGRVVPREGELDEAALARYAEIIDAHRSAGLRVAVTLLHFALPRWLAARGGMLAPDAHLRFRDFVYPVVRALRGSVWQWHTVNEPLIMATSGYLTGEWPPRARHPLRLVRAVRALLRAHVAAARVVRALDDAPVGIVHNFASIVPPVGATATDRTVARAAAWCTNGWLLEALATGRVRPPWGVGELLEGLRDSTDFLGVNYYQRVQVSLRRWPLVTDSGEGSCRTQMGWRACPEGLAHVLKLASALRVPLYVTENGIATDDDAWRERFMLAHLGSALRARSEGVDVRGYFYWSWIDNFEWTKGYAPKFGLVAVDPETLQRLPRPSATLYSRLVRGPVNQSLAYKSS